MRKAFDPQLRLDSPPIPKVPLNLKGAAGSFRSSGLSNIFTADRRCVIRFSVPLLAM